MPSLIAWLDASSEEQRRMRDIIRLFADRESRDELGLGQLRDGISDALFPGTSTLLTRARYLLFVPWAYRKAASHAMKAVAKADQFERETIAAIKDTDDYAGLLGMQAGVALKTLPSSVYWTMLRHYRILAEPTLTREDALRLDGTALGADDELTPGTRFRAWSATLPEAPPGFPQEIEGGFALRGDEAAWLRDRILDRVPDTYMSHLALVAPSHDSPAPWADPASLSVAPQVQELLFDARSFSGMMHGAQLLYNLMLAEDYENAGLDRVVDPVAGYRADLDAWEEALPGLVDLHSWSLDELIARVELDRGSPVHPSTRRFVRGWFDLLRESPRARLETHQAARAFLLKRERQNKGAQARLGNPRRLSGWGGGSGAGALVFRWPTVRKIFLDLHDGLGRGVNADA